MIEFINFIDRVIIIELVTKISTIDSEIAWEQLNIKIYLVLH